jgi:hypothetical protein
VPSRDPILIQSRRDPSRRVILLRDFRLNGWQRIGIVLSILSALGGYVLAIVALFKAVRRRSPSFCPWAFHQLDFA